MADTNLLVKNGAGASVYIKELGAGTSGDPNRPVVSVEAITAALPAGTNLVGKFGIDQVTADANRVVSGGGTTIAQTPTVTNGAYSAKDSVGGKLTFAGAVRLSGGSGIINTLVITDKSQAAAALTLVLYDQDFTASNDNAAFDPSDADDVNCIGVIQVTAQDYASFNDNEVAVIRGVGIQFKATATTIYGQLMCTGTPTLTSTSDLTVKLAIQYLD